MKFKNLFLAGLALVSMTACSNEDDPQATTPENVNAYMQLIVSGNGENASRANSHDENETGSADESTISDLTIYLCKDNKVNYAYPVKGTDLISTSKGLKTPPLQAVTGSYQVYVIANAEKSALDIKSDATTAAKGTNLDQLVISAVSQAEMHDKYALAKNFIMFNESKGKVLTPQTITINAENDYQTPATLANPIKLDRLAVKITSSAAAVNIDELKKTEGELNGKFSKVTLKGFKLLNGIQKANLRQNWLFDTKGTTFGSRLNTLVTPATPGYYNGLTDLATITIDNSVYKAAQNNYYNFAKYGENETDPIYCMENNSGLNGTTGAQALMGNTTGVVYQFQAQLNDIAEKTGAEAVLGHDTFYWYNGTYYATLTALEAANPTIFTDKSTTLSNVITELGDILKMPASNAGEITAREKALSDFRINYMIKVYDNGMMYYTHYITDENYKQLNNGKIANEDKESNVGYVPSILRNNIYALTVTKLLRIGNDIPGGWNPESKPDEPVNPTNVYMQVEVKVNPWTLQNQDVELK